MAIKHLKRRFKDWDECLEMPEVKALRKLLHPNIIKLKELIRVKEEAFLVFEYIQSNLFTHYSGAVERGETLPEREVLHLARQFAEAMAYIHRQGYFHRDLKPENILVDADLTVKVIDFGIAKEMRSKPPFTDYIATRWYRAP